jgi:uncharacterized membrane-anchored protein YjiN (DUF445 family)
MGVKKMGKLLDFPKKEQKVVLMPKVFARLYELYKQKQDEIKQQKIKFLERQAYEYFDTVIPIPEVRIEEIDIPYFVKLQEAYKNRTEQIAEQVCRVMHSVVSDNRVDECYSKRIKELKKKGLLWQRHQK